MKKIMTLLLALLFTLMKSFGQVKEIKISVDSPRYVMKAAYENKTMDIEVMYGQPDSVLYIPSDTIFTTRVIRLPTNTNSSLLMTKTKFVVRKMVGDKLYFRLFDPTGKEITTLGLVELYSYESAFKTWVSL